MGKYSYGRGSKKDVEKFTKWQGLVILATAGGILAGLIFLWLAGYMRLDVH
jgi:hypothetical protein